MEYKSIFEIIGPRMVGPSSSHTAGAVAIGRAAIKIFHEKVDDGHLLGADIYLYGSFSTTYKGHATDVALVGGLLGLAAHDIKIKDAFALARDRGIDMQIIPCVDEKAPADKEMPLGENNPHPNTAKIIMKAENKKIEVVGVSIGGGSFKIIDVNEY